MGVGGNFWDLLKPYARHEGFEFLRNKRVAVDLSYWVVQHETAIKGYTRNPHIRITFFRTVNLFSKFGAFPVFVLDGTPSPLKSQARIKRFLRSSGIDLSSSPEAEKGVSVERNRAFKKCIAECVELLELLGMPILKAKGEAEALCAQLNREGLVDACITADSDAFLYGALCVIKRIQPNSKEPFECYNMPDIETGLHLGRNHLIAVSLMVGNDHDLNGITGIGLETAVRFVKCFSDNEILNRLHDVARGDPLVTPEDESVSSSDAKSQKIRLPHCSYCGHPGNKKAHLKSSCKDCNSTAGQSCWQKPAGFKCSCTSCDLDREERAKKKDDSWKHTVCRKIASEQNFPNEEIIQMYLSNHNGVDDKPHVRWANPNTEMLVDYLAYQQNWEPSYIRQRLLPMLSTIYLREMASNPTSNLLCRIYEFHSIERIKVRYGHQSYVLKWKRAAASLSDAVHPIPEKSDMQSVVDLDESFDLTEDADAPYIHIDSGGCFLSTDEDMDLVHKAFPGEAAQFLKEKELREMKSQKKKSKQGYLTPEKTESSASRGVQLNITEFYRSSKVHSPVKPEETAEKVCDSAENKRKDPSSRFSNKQISFFSTLMYLQQYREGDNMYPEVDANEGIVSIGILVVNDDQACQNNVAKVLRRCSYQVLHTGTVYDALHAIWEKKDRIDLVITNARKLKSEGLAIIQNIEQKLKLNVLPMSNDQRIEPKRELFSFSAYELNGLSITGFYNLLENARLMEEDKMAAKNVDRASISDAAAETNKASSSNDEERLNQKRKAAESCGRNKKRPRFNWTNEMHEKFLIAVERLGGPIPANPSEIVKIMQVPGLSREQVASHLQKHRLVMKDMKEGAQSIGNLTSSTASRLPAFRTNLTAFSHIPAFKESNLQYTSPSLFGSTPGIKFYTRFGVSRLNDDNGGVVGLRNTTQFRDESSSCSKFVGFRFDGNRIDYGPIKKDVLFCTPERSENQSASYAQHIGSILQESCLLGSPSGEAAAMKSCREADSISSNAQEIEQSWGMIENAATASSMFPPPYEDLLLPPVEAGGNGLSEQSGCAFGLQQAELPEMFQDLDEIFNENGKEDDILVNGIENTCHELDYLELDDSFFSS